MTPTPRDPRSRRSPFSPRDAAGAAAALEAAAGEMRSTWLEQHPAPVDEPPTGLLDLAAIRAAIDADSGDGANPAAVRWLAGDPDPEPEPVPSFDEWVAESDADAADALREAVTDDRAATGLEPAPVEHPCAVLPNAYHSDAPCGPAHHPAPVCQCPMDATTRQMGRAPSCPLHGYTDDTPASGLPAEGTDVSVPDPEPVEVSPSPQPAPVEPVTPPPAAPVSIPERQPTLTQGGGWRSRHDERSRGYGVRSRLFGSAPLTDHALPIGPVLDQGREGACFGYAGTAARNTLELLAGRPARFGADDALTLYRRAQQCDEVPGEAYAGTSVTGGMAAGVELGVWGGYLWDFGTRDVAQTILKLQRPVIIGVRWLSGMFDTGPGGLVKLAGDDEGLGHCLSVFALRLKGPQGQAGPYFGWQCSYGTGYGDDGIGWVHHRDLAALLHGTGEAAVPTDHPVDVPPERTAPR